MTTELKNLMALRSRSEQNILDTELRNIATQASAAGQYTGTPHVKEGVRAGANRLTAFCEGAFNDYKAVVDVDRQRYRSTRLNDIKKDFLQLLREEKQAVEQVLQNRVGGIAKHFSPQGLSQYNQLDQDFKVAIYAAESRAELYNKKMLESAPSLPARIRAKVEDHPIGAIAVVSTPVVVFIQEKWGILQIIANALM